MVDSILRSGLTGLQTGFERSAQSADRITKAFLPDSTEDPVVPLIELKQASNQVKASAKVIKVGDEMLGTVLDILG